MKFLSIRESYFSHAMRQLRQWYFSFSTLLRQLNEFVYYCSYPTRLSYRVILPKGTSNVHNASSQALLTNHLSLYAMLKTIDQKINCLLLQMTSLWHYFCLPHLCYVPFDHHVNSKLHHYLETTPCTMTKSDMHTAHFTLNRIYTHYAIGCHFVSQKRKPGQFNKHGSIKFVLRTLLVKS